MAAFSHPKEESNTVAVDADVFAPSAQLPQPVSDSVAVNALDTTPMVGFQTVDAGSGSDSGYESWEDLSPRLLLVRFFFFYPETKKELSSQNISVDDEPALDEGPTQQMDVPILSQLSTSGKSVKIVIASTGEAVATVMADSNPVKIGRGTPSTLSDPRLSREHVQFKLISCSGDVELLVMPLGLNPCLLLQTDTLLHKREWCTIPREWCTTPSSVDSTAPVIALLPDGSMKLACVRQD